ncbi:MAG: bifunctional metallophosphatase/5'-nucleotidase [bacterium]
MSKSFARLISGLFFLLSISGLSVHAQTVTLKIIETSDVHGAIYPYDFINDREANGSLAQVYTFVQQERANQEQHVILLDNGDILQGQPVVYYYNFEKDDQPHLYARVMNFMGYDAATVGNHDIETGHAVYDKFNQKLSFPWMAANAVTTDDGEPYFKPYTVIEKQGVKMAVLGIITPGIPNWLPASIWQGMEFQDMIVCARKWLPIIQEREKPDVLVGLFHSGVDYTYGNQTAETPSNENASRLVAEQVPGFDVIFVGHDHARWNFTVKNSAGKEVRILGPTSNARTVAVATITLRFDATQNTWDKKVRGELVEIKSYEADKPFLKKFAEGLQSVKNYVSKPIGRFTKSVSTRDAIFGNSAFVDLIHQIQLELTGADVSFTAPLSFEARIQKGTVFVRDMFKLYKYENLLYTMELSGQEIKDLLEYSYGRWFNQMQNADDHLLNFVRDDQGRLRRSARNGSYYLNARTYNFDSAAGIRYTVDVSKPAGSRVVIQSMADGSPFELHQTYRVAINSYRGNGGGGHLTNGAKIPKAELAERVLASTDKDLRFYLMKWIEKNKVVTPKLLGNWKVIPEPWWQAARKRDFQLLFGRKME